MLICDSCGAVFSEDRLETVKNWVPYGNGEVAEEWGGCPRCHDTNIGEARECEECGEYFAQETLKEGLCEDCYGEIYGK